MWIIRYGSVIQPLEFNRSYLIGRDEDCDFKVNSTLVSRQQLQLKLGLVDKQQLKTDDYKTPLFIGILSRARSNINGESYKLAKNEKPVDHEFTKERLIDIEFKDSNNPTGSINYEIEWIPFNIMPTTTDTKSNLFNDLKRLHHESIDLRTATDMESATHCYTLKDIPKGNTEDYDNVCLAMAKGIPILTNQWFKFVYEKNEFQEWFLDINYKQYLPKYDGELLLTALPKPSRSSVLGGFNAFSFNEFHFEENVITLMGGKIINISLIKYFIDGKLDQSLLSNEIKSVNGKCLLVKYAATDKIKYDFPINDQLEAFCKTYNSQIINKDLLLECLENCSSDKISPIDVGLLKHPLEGSTQPTQGRRKRVKYEKLSKMHFFELEATPSQPEPSPVQVQVKNDSKESTAPTEIEMERGNTTSPKSVELGPSSPVASPRVRSPSLLEDKIQDSEQANDISKSSRVTLKRSNSKSDQPKKISKFKPDYKVSLSTAIQQTKALASKLVEEELGIETKDDDINGGMENLVIVEIVDIPMRNVPKSYNEVENDRYSGRKNFKTFKKNLKVKANVTRSFVDLEDASIKEHVNFVDDFVEPQTISAEAQMETQFNGFIKDVVVPEGNGLFVDDSDTEEMPESIFTSHTDSTSKSTRSKSRPTSGKPRRTLYNIHNKNDSDGDDDDDDDDGPKFGFTRKR